MRNLQARGLFNLNTSSKLVSEPIVVNELDSIKEGVILNLNRTSIRFKQFLKGKKNENILLYTNSRYIYSSKEKLSFDLDDSMLSIIVYKNCITSKGSYVLDKMPIEVELYKDGIAFAIATLDFSNCFYLKIDKRLL